MKEIWKPISQNLYYLGVDENYEVSNTGKVRNKKTGHILKVTPINGDSRRLKVQVKCSRAFCYLSLQISHVVYDTFVGDCYGKAVYHRDGNSANNSVENLYVL
jgi:hypothetical protein